MQARERGQTLEEGGAGGQTDSLASFLCYTCFSCGCYKVFSSLSAGTGMCNADFNKFVVFLFVFSYTGLLFQCNTIRENEEM